MLFGIGYLQIYPSNFNRSHEIQVSPKQFITDGRPFRFIEQLPYLKVNKLQILKKKIQFYCEFANQNNDNETFNKIQYLKENILENFE